MADILYYGITVNDGVGHQPVYMKDMLTEGIAIARELSPKASLFVDSHSPDGFSWGRSGSGTSQLAIALLLDVTGEAELARKYATLFTETFLLNLSRTWAMTALQIRRFVQFNEVLERLEGELGASPIQEREKIEAVFGGRTALWDFAVELAKAQGIEITSPEAKARIAAFFTLGVDIGRRMSYRVRDV